jgi:glucosyl-dolichyl phosphate glucuronosyltransferase
LKISIVIPTFNREEHLKNCLSSLLAQIKKPFEILVIDNSNNKYAKKIVNIFEEQFKIQNISIYSFKNPINSGAIARNLGASKAKGDLIAFLDDDVLLDSNYYEEIEKVFLKYPNALGVHGYNKLTNKAYEKMKNSFLYSSLENFVKFFKISSYYEEGKSRVLPSLCITNPIPTSFNSIVQSEWVSTCAGVFSKKVFSKFNFDNQFMKYSWNEYLDFSYSIYKENKESLFVSPKAKYIDVATNDGRMSLKELIYMSEVYDMYIFLKRFEMTYKNILIYAWSMFGRVIYSILKILIRYPKQIKLILDCLYAPVYVMLNFSKIKKGDLDFFNKTLS